MSRQTLFRFLGLIFLIIPIGINKYSLTNIFSLDRDISIVHSISLYICDAFLIILGTIHIIFSKKSWIINMDMCIISSFIAFLPIELYLRGVELKPEDRDIDQLKLRRMDTLTHHSLTPNIVVRNEWGNKNVEYATNSLGYRDEYVREVERDTPASKRLLLLGDSFVESMGIEYRHSFIKKLKEKFKKQCVDIEILNSGVCSYCPLLEYRVVQKFFKMGYTTDWVLLFLDISDVYDEAIVYGDWTGFSSQEFEKWQKSNGEYILKIKKKKDKRKWFYLIYPRLLGIIDVFIRKHILHSAKFQPFAHLANSPRCNWTEQDTGLTENNWIGLGISRIKKNILKIAKTCNKKNISFTIVIYPHPLQCASSNIPSLHQNIFHDFAYKNQIDIIDLFPHFRDRQNYQQYFIPGDVHWNNNGHALVADILFRLLNQRIH